MRSRVSSVRRCRQRCQTIQTTTSHREVGPAQRAWVEGPPFFHHASLSPARRSLTLTPKNSRGA